MLSQSKSVKKIQYSNIDLFKLIFAIIVVSIHTLPFKEFSESFTWYYNNTLANLAVPFFFITSGFLLFDKLNKVQEADKNSIVKKYVIHIWKMYFVWCVIWLPWKLLNFYNEGNFALTELIKYIRDVIFVSGGDALWYLNALAFSVLTTYYIQKKFGVKQVLLVAGIFYCLGVVLGSWYGLVENNFIVKLYFEFFASLHNGLFGGFFYVALGSWAAKEKNKNKKWAGPAFVASFTVTCFEAIVVKYFKMGFDGGAYLFSLPVSAYCLFMLILNIDMKPSKKLEICRDYSTLIYLSHCFIIRLIKMISAVLGINMPGIALFFVNLVFSSVFAVAVRYFAKEKENQILQIVVLGV